MSIPVPLPRIAAFEKLGLGLFVHWGLYSQLGQGEWTLHIHNRDLAEYKKLRDTFTACDFDAEDLARTAKNAGMNYIVLTTRHHEGFSLYNTCGLNDYDAPHSAAKRDLVAEFVNACRKYDLLPFFYHTTMDWYWHDKKTRDLDLREFDEYLDYLHQSVKILCTNYGKIGGFWFDGNWCRLDDWKENRLYSMIRKHQPDAIIVNNTGIHARGRLGHPEIDSVTFENGAASPMDREGAEKYIAAEVCRTINGHWGVGELDFNYMSPKEIIMQLCHARRCGANYLLNIGPSAQGGIPDMERSLLNTLGRWIKLYGEAVYDAKPTSIKCQGQDFVLQSGNDYYLFVHDMGVSGNTNVVCDTAGIGTRSMDRFTARVTRAVYLDNGQEVPFVQDLEQEVVSVKLTGYSYGMNTCVRVVKLEGC